MGAEWVDCSGRCRVRQGQSHRSALALPQGNMDQERLKKQQELAAAALYQQLQHQQFLQLVGRYGGAWKALVVRLGPGYVASAPIPVSVPAAGSSHSARSGRRQLWGT